MAKKGEEYISYPNCDDCIVDSEGRTLCNQSVMELNGVSTIVKCEGIHHDNCDYKINIKE